MTDLNPFVNQMADESMVRTLAAQTTAIWPQERAFFARYQLPAEPTILDAGCGTGEGTVRLGELFGQARILGIDIIDAHLTLAAARGAALGPRVSFAHQSMYDIDAADDTFDLTVCRHVLHSIPETARALRELVRVTRPGGYVHLVPEDYGMLHFQAGQVDLDEFWDKASTGVARTTGTDAHMGRNTFTFLQALGLTDVQIDYVVVDTIRVARETFAEILVAWRDGYVDTIVASTPLHRTDVEAAFEQAILSVRDPAAYAVWFVPVVAARVPNA